jgi:putative CocE/NonD family hydrolase
MRTRPAPTADQFSIEIQRDARIPSGVPGLTLSADVYRPRVDVPVPALVTVLPYRKDFVAGAGYEEPARWFAERGYASLVVDLLGTGQSDGIRRPEFDPGDADDGVAAVGWAAGQPWCDGAVGMWGLSYAANVALRTASRRPPALRAIVAVAHGLDPARDSVHPDGARGDLHALANRGSSLLLQQLLPPLADSSPSGRRRWLRRLREAEPAFLDYARHGPDDPVWRERAIDGAAVVTPALCVGGWRDAFPDGVVDAYERVAGPKKLLMGPWGHLLPHRSAYQPVDFPAIALRWWDHWLRGLPTGVMDEPAVTLFRPGPPPRWLGYDRWPPPAADLALGTGADTTLAPRNGRGPGGGHVIARHRPDATVGALRGLPGLGMGEDFGPEDQRDDDRRSVSATSAPLRAPIVVGGRPEVRVSLRGSVRRLCVRLTDVHPDGRSVLVTAGVACPPPDRDRVVVRLRPIVAPVEAGHRLRVAVGEADFPRLMPLVEPDPFDVTSVEVSVPVLAEDRGVPVVLPAVPGSEPEPANDLRISRDGGTGEVEVVVTGRVSEQVSPGGDRYRIGSELRARVGPAAPEHAVASGTQTGEVRLAGGELVTASATVRCAQTAVSARAEVRTNGSIVFARTWETVLVPEYPAVGGR